MGNKKVLSINIRQCPQQAIRGELMKVTKMKELLKNEWFLLAITSPVFVFLTWLYYKEPEGSVVPQIDTEQLIISTILFMIGSLSIAYLLNSLFSINSKGRSGRKENMDEHEDCIVSTEIQEVDHTEFSEI